MRYHFAGDASPKKQEAGYEVGSVQTGREHGDDVFEDSGGADVDQGEETREGCNDCDSHHRDVGSALNLVNLLQPFSSIMTGLESPNLSNSTVEGQAAVARKRPCHP